MNINTNPKIYDNLYKTKIKNMNLVFNPYSYKRPLLFPQKFASLYKSIDGKKKLEDYYRDRLTFDLTKEEIKGFFQMLTEFDITTAGDKKNTLTPNPRGSRYWRFTVWLHMTNDCNFSCKYCFVSKNHEKITLEDLIKSTDRIVETAVKNKIKRVTLVLGGGEPLLQYQLIKKLNEHVVVEAKKYNLSIRLAIITNGSLLNEENIKYFKDNKFNVGISIDGTEKYHDAARVFKDGSGTFERVKKGLELADKHKILSNISMTLTTENVKGLPDFVRYILNLNPKIRIMLGLVKNTALSVSNKAAEDKVMISELKKAYRVIGDFYAKKDLNFSYLFFHKLLDSVFMYEPHKYHCGAGSYYLTITHKGKLKLCPQLLDDTAMDVKEGEDLLTLAKANNFLYANDFNVEKIKECSKCLWKYACRGGCPCERHNTGKDIANPAADCHIYKTLIPFQIKLEGERLYKNMLFQVKSGEKK